MVSTLHYHLLELLHLQLLVLHAHLKYFVPSGSVTASIHLAGLSVIIGFFLQLQTGLTDLWMFW